MALTADRVDDYFASINPMARKIVKQREDVGKQFGNTWRDLTHREREALVDHRLVGSVVGEKYAGAGLNASYPDMKVACGERIIVDFEKECLTWQDEHSGPFSWKSKSQQDLSLADIESSLNVTSQKRSSRQSTSPERSNYRQSGSAELPWKPDKSIWESPFLAADRGYDWPSTATDRVMDESFVDLMTQYGVTSVRGVTPGGVDDEASLDLSRQNSKRSSFSSCVRGQTGVRGQTPDKQAGASLQYDQHFSRQSSTNRSFSQEPSSRSSTNSPALRQSSPGHPGQSRDFGRRSLSRECSMSPEFARASPARMSGRFSRASPSRGSTASREHVVSPDYVVFPATRFSERSGSIRKSPSRSSTQSPVGPFVRQSPSRSSVRSTDSHEFVRAASTRRSHQYFNRASPGRISNISRSSQRGMERSSIRSNRSNRDNGINMDSMPRSGFEFLDEW